MRHKILERIPQEQLQQDLERYRQRAIELGATDAKIITTDEVIIDERVLAKCTYPKCPSYGTNANCPPHAMSLEQVRKVVSNFSYGVFLKLEVPPEHTAGQEAIDKGLFNPYRKKLSEIAAKIEAEAFYDGYHLALAFASGSCKGTFCPDIECQALLPGQPCRYPLKSRTSMEGAGMDVYTMATKVGWDIYPIGAATSPADVPCGMRLALVLIY